MRFWRTRSKSTAVVVIRLSDSDTVGFDSGMTMRDSACCDGFLGSRNPPRVPSDSAMPPRTKHSDSAMVDANVVDEMAMGRVRWHLCAQPRVAPDL